jgi:hypothetical protein
MVLFGTGIFVGIIIGMIVLSVAICDDDDQNDNED